MPATPRVLPRAVANLAILTAAIFVLGCDGTTGGPEWHEVSLDEGPVASLRAPVPGDRLYSEQHADRWTIAPAEAGTSHDFSLAVYSAGGQHFEALDEWAMEVDIVEERRLTDARDRGWHLRYSDDGTPVAAASTEAGDVAFYGTPDWGADDLQAFFDHLVFDAATPQP